MLVFFGYPDAREDAADSPIRAGLEIQRLLAERVAEERIHAPSAFLAATRQAAPILR